MAKQKKEINAGVHATTGFEFQKHCALYLILDDFDTYNQREYYLYFEHHDDFLFCFHNGQDLFSDLRLYQAKKNSKAWSSNDLKEIILSISDKSVQVKNDNSVAKDTNIKNLLTFISNEFIKLEKTTVNESMCSVCYTKLEQADKDKINDGIISALQFNEYVNYNHGLKKEDLTVKKAKQWHEKLDDQIKNAVDTKIDSHSCWTEINDLTFTWIDLNKTTKAQKQCLIGKLNDVFGSKIADHKAALEALLLIFRDIENTFNQGYVRLAERKKRICSSEIHKAMKIITEQSLALDYWRNNKINITKSLSLSLPQKTKFEEAFVNSFELFKDLEQIEHQNILAYTSEHTEIAYEVSSEEEFVTKIVELYKSENSSRLPELELKAAFFAAYFIASNIK